MDVRNPDPNSSKPRTVKTANEARAGIKRMNVRNVLLISTGSLVVIFGLLWLFHFGR